MNEGLGRKGVVPHFRGRELHLPLGKGVNGLPRGLRENNLSAESKTKAKTASGVVPVAVAV